MPIFGHENILKYCSRPFHNAEHMFASMRNKWNARVKPDDIVVHVGDFCNRGNERGVPGSRQKFKEYADQLNGTIIYMRGNHDRNNGLKHTFQYAVMELGKIQFLIIHKPPLTLEAIPCKCDAIICGHVHTAWKEKWLGDKLMINVGVDVRNFAPVFASEVIGIHGHAVHERGRMVAV